jgi:hypothetical protein
MFSFRPAFAVATILMLLPVGAAQTIIPTPPSMIEQHEHVLSTSEIAASPCTDLARSVARKMPGVTLDSEKVSLNAEFGHIYRYDLVDPIEYKGTIHQVHTILVVWSNDCKTCMIATYPTFQLPDSSRPH